MTIAFSQAISARHFDTAIAADVTFVQTFINDKAKLAGIVFTWVLWVAQRSSVVHKRWGYVRWLF